MSPYLPLVAPLLAALTYATPLFVHSLIEWWKWGDR